MSAEVFFDETHVQGMQLIMKAAGVREVRIPMDHMCDPTLPGGVLRWWLDDMRDELVITYTPASAVTEPAGEIEARRALDGR